MTPSKLLLAMSALIVLSACGNKQEASQPAPEAAASTPAETAAPAAAPAETSAAPMDTSGMDAHQIYAARCASCHGATAEGVNGNPSLAKLSSDEIVSKLKDYRAGKTMGDKTAIMAPQAKGLSDSDIDALAQFLAG